MQEMWRAGVSIADLCMIDAQLLLIDLRTALVVLIAFQQ
jgi:hypothetical protein